jgi:bifunctional DNA-binding transcriptional regulator/antitoxin component of YhaV-PrlF toxin-antitoxin module
MNIRMSAAREIKLPDEVVDALGIRPGGELQIVRRPDGDFVLERAPTEGRRRTREEMLKRLRAVAGAAGPGPNTDEFMAMLRGD